MLAPATLWVDPGKMTGIALLTGGGNLSAVEWPFWPACREIESVCQDYGRRLAIGWERFDINDSTHKKTREGTMDALHMIGVLRFLTARHECRFLGEAAQHTPTQDEARYLARLGWWRPGKDDAQSAACHALRWLIRANELTPAMREVLYGESRPLKDDGRKGDDDGRTEVPAAGAAAHRGAAAQGDPVTDDR